jgi:hypothetical protein
MVGLRFADMRLRPTEFLDFTSLTVEEFQILIPPFEAAFQAHMAVWCLDGTARTARRFSVYQTCPLATPEDRLFFLLTYLKTYTLQVVQGRLFGMGQARPISGSMPSCRRCSRRCVTLAMFPPAPSRRLRADWVCRRRWQSWRRHRKNPNPCRRRCPRQSPDRSSPFCP